MTDEARAHAVRVSDVEVARIVSRAPAEFECDATAYENLALDLRDARTERDAALAQVAALQSFYEMERAAWTTSLERRDAQVAALREALDWLVECAYREGVQVSDEGVDRWVEIHARAYDDARKVLADTAAASEAFVAKVRRAVAREGEARGWRLVRVSTPFLSDMVARTDDGWLLTADWGDPDADGIYNLQITRSDDGFVARVQREAAERCARVVENAPPASRANLAAAIRALQWPEVKP